MLVTVFVIFSFVLINIGKVKDVSSSPGSAAFETLTDKKENKIYLVYCIRKFRVEQLQSHIRGRAS
jgi:hypothetical protein